MSVAYYREYTKEDLISGLARLPEDYLWCICTYCQGSGYTLRNSYNDCPCCEGYGISLKGEWQVAGISVINQILSASNVKTTKRLIAIGYREKRYYGNKHREKIEQEFKERRRYYSPSAKW